EEDPEHHLLHEEVGEDRAEDVAEAGAAGHLLLEGAAQQRADPGALVEPVDDLRHHASSLAAIPWRKRWKRIATRPPSSCTSRVSRGRGAGPSSTAPPSEKAERWHGHLNLPASGSKSTAQPRWGHTVEKAVSLPSSSITQAEPILTLRTRDQASTRSA